MIIRILCFVCPIFEGSRVGASIFDFFFFIFIGKQRMMCVPYLGGPVLAGRAGGQRTSPTRQRSAVDCYRVSEHSTKKLKVIIQISNRHS